MENSKGLVALICFLLIILFISFFIVNHISEFLKILKVTFYGLVFAYIFLPIVQFFEEYMKPSIAIILLVILILVIFILSILLFLPMLSNEITSLINRLPSYANKAKQYHDRIIKNMDNIELPHGFKESVRGKLNIVQKKVSEILFIYAQKTINVLSQSSDVFLSMVLGLYFLKDREYFCDTIIDIIPKSIRKGTLVAFREINRVLQSFIRVQLLISIIIAVLSIIGFVAIGLPYAFTLGLLCGIFEIIPYFGPLLGAIPALIISALNTPDKFIWTILVVMLVQQIEGNIITPQIMSYSTELHPAIIILILWTGGMLFGILGMLFAVPIFLIIRIIVKNIYIGIVSNS